MNLYDISTYRLVHRVLMPSGNWESMRRARLLIVNHVDDYGHLEELIESGNPSFDTPFFRSEVMAVKKYISRHDKRNLPPLYNFANYDDSSEYYKIFRETDPLNSGNILPLNAPYNVQRSLGFRLKDYSISDIKSLLSHYSLNRKIALVAHTPGVGDHKVKQIVECIRFYESQIIRASMEPNSSKYTGNLFIKDRVEKRKIVRDHLADMVSSLVEEGEEYIWGVSGDNQKSALLRQTIYPKTQTDQSVQSKMIQYFANYSTLSELEDEKTRNNVVKRFILKEKGPIGK